MMDDSSLESLFNEAEIEDIVTQEGLQAVTELFEFFVEALEVSIQWLVELLDDEEEYSHDQIRGIISGNVNGKSFEEIMNKFEALYEFSGFEEEA